MTNALPSMEKEKLRMGKRKSLPCLLFFSFFPNFNWKKLLAERFFATSAPQAIKKTAVSHHRTFPFSSIVHESARQRWFITTFFYHLLLHRVFHQNSFSISTSMLGVITLLPAASNSPSPSYTDSPSLLLTFTLFFFLSWQRLPTALFPVVFFFLLFYLHFLFFFFFFFFFFTSFCLFSFFFPFPPRILRPAWPSFIRFFFFLFLYVFMICYNNYKIFCTAQSNLLTCLNPQVLQ